MFIPLTNVWRPSKKYRIFEHHTAGLNLVGDRVLLMQVRDGEADRHMLDYNKDPWNGFFEWIAKYALN